MQASVVMPILIATQSTAGALMNMQSNEESRAFVLQTDDEKKEAMREECAEAIANRLKTRFSEARKSGATENPEVGCVAWYQFSQVGK
jgi:hypothetical protein